MNQGTEYHHQHANQAWNVRLTKFAAWILLIGGVILLTVAITLRILN